MTEKKKRGRPAGSKNRVTTLKQKRVLATMPAAFEFRSPDNLCDCVFYSNIMGAGMFCKHKNPLMARNTDI